MGMEWAIYSGIGLVAVGVVASGIRIVRPEYKMLVETLGKYKWTKEQGFTWIVPLIQRSVYVNMTERMTDVPPQVVITKDNLNAEVDAVVYYKIKDPYAAMYNVDNHQEQIVSLARTTLRAVVGKMTLSHANENRYQINDQVGKELQKETDSYGVDVLRVEIQRIEPPQDVQKSMNEVVKAEREKIASRDKAHAAEIEADGERRAAVKKAQGDKKSDILRAEGQAQAYDKINKHFIGNAIKHRQLEVTENSLQDNSKIVLTKDGIDPSIIMDSIPVNNQPVKKQNAKK